MRRHGAAGLLTSWSISGSVPGMMGITWDGISSNWTIPVAVFQLSDEFFVWPDLQIQMAQPVGKLETVGRNLHHHRMGSAAYLWLSWVTIPTYISKNSGLNQHLGFLAS